MAGEQKNPCKKAADNKYINTSPWRKNSEEMDWDALRHEWVTTNISVVGLAEKYGLSVTSVRNHYNRYNWKDELRKFHNMIDEAYEAALEKKAKQIAERAIELDAVILKSSEQIAGLIEMQINELNHNISCGNDEVTLEKLDSLAKTLKVASETLKNSHYNIRLASDRATSIVKEDENKINPLGEDEQSRVERELGYITPDKDKIRNEIKDQDVDSKVTEE